MLSNPVFSRLDAAIIAVLLCSGTALMIESHHRIEIVASERPEASLAEPDVSADFTASVDPILAQARAIAEPTPSVLVGE
jgi:hypothetical protein